MHCLLSPSLWCSSPHTTLVVALYRRLGSAISPSPRFHLSRFVLQTSGVQAHLPWISFLRDFVLPGGKYLVYKPVRLRDCRGAHRPPHFEGLISPQAASTKSNVFAPTKSLKNDSLWNAHTPYSRRDLTCLLPETYPKFRMENINGCSGVDRGLIPPAAVGVHPDSRPATHEPCSWEVWW